MRKANIEGAEQGGNVTWLESLEFVFGRVNLKCLLNILVEMSKGDLDRCMESREEGRAKM